METHFTIVDLDSTLTLALGKAATVDGMPLTLRLGVALSLQSHVSVGLDGKRAPAQALRVHSIALQIMSAPGPLLTVSETDYALVKQVLSENPFHFGDFVFAQIWRQFA